MQKLVTTIVVAFLFASSFSACGNAEAEKAAAAAKQKAFMEAEAQARTAEEDKERKEKTDAATQKCSAGDAQGCIDLGKVKLETKDAAAAVKAFDDACDKKSKEGCALAAQHSKAPADALPRHQKGCALDDADACVAAIGALDALAKAGQTVDPQAQLALLDKACNLGIGRTCTALGVLTVAADTKGAADAFDRGCKAKEPTACVQLADLYKNGKIGKKKDDKKAAALLKEACDLGLVDVCTK